LRFTFSPFSTHVSNLPPHYLENEYVNCKKQEYHGSLPIYSKQSYTGIHFLHSELVNSEKTQPNAVKSCCHMAKRDWTRGRQ
jgi:hypothetical protein